MQQAFGAAMGVHEMLGQALDQMRPLAGSLRSAVAPLGRQRSYLRSTLGELGALRPLPDDGAYLSLTAVDGAYALAPLFIGDQINVLALSVSSDLGTGSVAIEGYRAVNEFFPHSPATETYAKAAMLSAELILAGEAASSGPATAVTVLDGSHSTAIASVLEALALEGSAAYEYICGDVMSDQIVSAVEAVAESEAVVACPKSDSSTDICDFAILHGVDLPMRLPDKVLASLVLDGGEVLDLPESHAPWERCDLISQQITSSAGQELRDRLRKASAPIREDLRVAHVKPSGASTAVRVETKASLDDFATLDVWQAIADDCAPPHTQEPVAQYIADHLAKNVAELSKVQLDEARLDLAESADDELLEFLIRSYRTI